MTLNLALWILSASGCTHYEYDLVRPAAFAQHIGEQRDALVSLGPLDYRMRSFEDHLVIRIYNRAANPVHLSGDRSVVVDPHHQSRPLRSQTIAPGTFVKLILPPLPPQAEPNGPAVSFGIGGGFFGGRRGGFGGAGLYDTPNYTIVDHGETYWNWSGESDVDLNLSFESPPDKTYSHEFVFHRRKM